MVSARISSYIRDHHLGLVAIFIALTGTAYAGSKIDSSQIAKNAVKSKHVKNGQIKSVDVANEKLKSKDIKNGQIRTPDLSANAVDGEAVLDDSLTGSDIDESSLDLGLAGTFPPSGPAGGSLTGKYPDPGIAADAIAGPQVLNNGLTIADIDKSTLGSFPPNGPSGGALDGDFPNPTIASDAVGSAEIDDGSVTPADQAVVPAARAEIGGGDPDQAIANNAFVRLDWPTENFDTAGLFDDGGDEDRMTAPIEGMYAISAWVSWEYNTTSYRRIDIRGFPSQDVIALDQDDAVDSGGLQMAQSISAVAQLDAGQPIEVQVVQVTGAPLDVMSGALTMTWIGPTG